MPTGKGGKPEDRRGSKTDDRRGSNPVKRETFRPPWVKDDPDGLPPKPSNLWSKTRKNSRDGTPVDGAEGSKKSDVVKATEPQENGTKDHIFVKPQLKPVPPKDTTKLQSREVKIPIKLNSVKKTKSIDENLEKAAAPVEKNPIMRQDSLKKIGNIPKPPPIPPPAPKLPRPTELKPLSNKQKDHIEALKNRPKVRPDWTSLLKEVESGAKLKHVQCNDRSKPLLPKAMDNDKNAFIYESEKKEKGTAHNKLLNEIAQGVSLKKVKTNDRSKPMLEGLRKFRRQMTIEEQIIKSQSMASIPPEEIPELVDELDDIDRVRDDLQSTKQMLAMELRNKEALARENKRIATRLAQLEAELEKERANKKTTSVAAAPVETDDKLVKTLKNEAADAKKTAEDLEKKYNDASSQLDNTKTELEEVRKQKLQLEKKLMDSIQVSYPTDKRLSMSDRKESINKSESEKEESCESDGGSDEESKKERKALKEYKQFRNKLRSNKNKEDNAKKERMALKTQIKRLQQAIKDEKKKYKALKKEVNKMAALMKEVSDEEDEGEEKEEPEDVEEDEAAESESDSESESSEDSESEKSLSEAEDAPVEKKKANVVKRTKKHEGRLSALKKGNYILKTNVERLQDDLNKQKDLSLELQQDLDSVLSELG